MNNEISRFRDFRYPVELRRRDTGITISYHQQKRDFRRNDQSIMIQTISFRPFQILHHSKSL